MKDSFILYTEYREQIEQLSMSERGELFTAILDYASGVGLPELSPVVGMAFSFIRSRLDRDAEKYAEVCEKRREAGRIGGLSKSKQKLAKASKCKQSLANQADNDIDNDNDKEKESNKEKEKRFIPPTVEEVRAYAHEYSLSKGLPDIDPEGFIDFYASKGWIVGKTKMKDWKAAVRNWFRRDGKKKPGSVINFSQRDESYNKMLDGGNW